MTVSKVAVTTLPTGMLAVSWRPPSSYGYSVAAGGTTSSATATGGSPLMMMLVEPGTYATPAGSVSNRMGLTSA